MNRNISLASRDPLPLGREDIYKGMEEIGAYLDAPRAISKKSTPMPTR